MKISELKEKLISGIQEENNEALIEEIYALLNPEDEQAQVYKLTDDQKVAISEAQAQYRAGAYMTDSEAQKHFDKWRWK